MFQLLLGLVCLTVAPLTGKDLGSGGKIFSHGSIRQSDHVLEAVLEVAAELVPNIHTGQQVLLDVRQGQLRGTVKKIHSACEITIALDSAKSKIKLSRLQPGQAVIGIIQLEPDCNCEIPELL